MEEGEMVLIEYTGRAEGEVFDTTREEVAKEHGLEREDADYRPVPVLVGRGYVIEGLEDAVKDMEVGESRSIEVPPGKAYGERSSDEVETYPEREFRKQDVKVSPGEEVIIGDRRGKVISAGSGRVRIDFNHPLSGKELEYDVEVLEKVGDGEQAARRIYEYRVGEGEPEFGDGKVTFPSETSHGDHTHEIPEDVKETVREEVEAATGLEVEFRE